MTEAHWNTKLMMELYFLQDVDVEAIDKGASKIYT